MFCKLYFRNCDVYFSFMTILTLPIVHMFLILFYVMCYITYKIVSFETEILEQVLHIIDTLFSFVACRIMLSFSTVVAWKICYCTVKVISCQNDVFNVLVKDFVGEIGSALFNLLLVTVISSSLGTNCILSLKNVCFYFYKWICMILIKHLFHVLILFQIFLR